MRAGTADAEYVARVAVVTARHVIGAGMGMAHGVVPSWLALMPSSGGSVGSVSARR